MDVKDIEQYIKQIKAVESCKIIVDDQSSIQELHIISNTKRSPKQISRDIQSVLISQFGIDIDHKKISIAQINIDSIDNENIRLRLRTIEHSTTDSKAEVRVVLQKDEELFEGIASGANSTYNIHRLLARAALNAVENYCGVESFMVLEDIKTTMLAGKDAVIVAVTVILGGTELLLSGSAIVSRDNKEAIVKATLDAINRCIIKYQSDIQAS